MDDFTSCDACARSRANRPISADVALRDGQRPAIELADLDACLVELDDMETNTAADGDQLDELRGRIEILMDEIENARPGAAGHHSLPENDDSEG